MSNVKACPFCGSEDVLEQDTGINIPYLLCNDCHAQGPHSFSPALRWNFRAEQSELTTLREQVKVLREALGLAKAYVKNGIDLGYITPMEPGDVAYETLPKICAALEQTKPKEGA